MAKTSGLAVRKSLIAQLERNGATDEHYVDLVDDYMRLWRIKDELQADVAKRGAKVEIYTASAVNIKTNDSVLDLLKVNAQMLKILEALNLKPVEEPHNAPGNDDDEM